MLDLILSSLRLATPLVFAAQAGLLSERSGLVNLALEGFLLLGAFVAASTAALTGSLASAWIIASLAGLLMASIFAFIVIRLRGPSIITATALNLLVFGLIPILSKFLFNSTGSTPVLPIELRLEYAPLVLMFVVSFVLFLYGKYTRQGLYWRTAGESAFALETVGVSVDNVRFTHLLASGLVATWGGVSLSLFLSSGYSPMMSGGRGFIALAALILGRWKPLLVLGACLLFGFFESSQMQLQGASWYGISLPVQLVQMFPYILTLLVLVIFRSQQEAPRELGEAGSY